MRRERYVNNYGYQMIYEPTHLRADRRGYVLEHLVIAEKALGKPLPLKAMVHHYGAKLDNTKLVICEDQAYHKLLHQRTDALRATGNANARKCDRCGEYGDQSDISVAKVTARSRGNGVAYHKACMAAYQRKRRPR